MKNFICFISLFFLFGCVQKEKVDYNDLVSRKDTLYKKQTNIPFSGESIGRVQGIIKEGKFDGIVNFYFKNGSLQKVVNYQSGKIEGVEEVYFENGNLKQINNYTGGKKNGMHQEFFGSGQLNYEANYVNDMLEGEAVYYFKSGKVSVTSSFKNNERDGEQIIYWDNDNDKQVQSKTTWSEGKQVGPFETYSEDGILLTKGTNNGGSWEKPCYDGLYEEYRSDGSLLKKLSYENCIKTGTQEFFYDDGSLWKTELCTNGICELL